MMRGEVSAGGLEGAWTSGIARAACRGAHMKHALHGCDAGRVETQRLVECRSLLPSRKEGVRIGARCEVSAGPERDGGGRVQASAGKRTPNMPYMVVTLDVSRFSGWLNDDARCQVEQGACRFNAGCEVRAGRKEGVEWWHKQYACRGNGPKGKWELVGRAWSARRTLRA